MLDATELGIRPASPSDAARYAFVATETFFEAYVATSGLQATRPIEIVRFLLCTGPLARSRRFHEKCGLRAVGKRPFLFGEVWEDHIVYSKSPSADSSG